MAGPRYDFETVYEWFANGAKGNAPKPILSEEDQKKFPAKSKNQPDRKPGNLPYNKKQLARDLPQAIASNSKAYFIGKDYTSDEELEKSLPHIWNAIYQNWATAQTGAWFVETFKISKESTPLVYELLGEITPEAIWKTLEQKERNRILFQYLLTFEKYGNKTYKTYSHSFFEFNLNRDGTIESEGHEFIETNLQEEINKIFLTMNLPNQKDFDIYSQKSLSEEYRTYSDLRADTAYYQREAAKQRIQTDNSKRTTLKLKEAVEKLGEDGDAKANAFFKNVEQCLLLANVREFSTHRTDLRKKNINDNNIPYGGRIIPVDCEPNTSFMNYSSTTGQIWDYTKIIDSGIINAINYNFIVSNIAEVETKDDGIREIEMPLLFGGQKNILSKNEEPTFKHVVLYGEQSNQETDSKRLEVILGKSTDINTDIKYDNVEISFIGENQATAKTNVDVSLKLTMPNLTYLQAEFEGKTTYFDDQGNQKDYDYIYSPLDLITYLHRTSLRPAGSGDPINIKKYQGCARLYNPKFLKSYQRLVMKIIPTINTTGLNDLQINYVSLLKKYIEDNHLILDLALIDHTIKRSVQQEGGKVLDELTIQYKGYIRSKLQDPIFDCLRTKEQMKNLIDKEEGLISSLSAKDLNSADKKQQSLDDIKKHNEEITLLIKGHKDSFKEVLFNRIKKNNQIWTFEYTPTEILDNNITKDFKIANSSIIAKAMQNVTPTQKSGNIDVESITKKTNFSSLPLDFVYFGDLVDVLMDNMYEGEDRRTDGTTKAYEQMEEEHKTFPLKIVLPSFYPIEYDFSSKTFKVSNDKMNLADFPIAISWLDKWIDKNIVEPDVAFYSIGPLMHAIISSLVNGMLVDECYLNGSAEFLQFGLKSEFGLFKGNGYVADDYSDTLDNSTMKNQNKTSLNEILMHVKGSNTAVAHLNQNHAPFFKKDPNLPMSQHCNFLVIYQQVAVFSNYKSLLNKPETLQQSGIPYFNLYSKTAQGTISTLTKSIEFSKATANYQRETRFELESLYSLAQLASVYNVTVATNTLLLDVFPGMIIFVDAGLYQDSSVIGSVAHTLGMGGFHLNEKVTHKAGIVINKLNKVETSISANWIYSGAEEITQETNEEQNDPDVPKKEQKAEERQTQELREESDDPNTPETKTKEQIEAEEKMVKEAKKITSVMVKRKAVATDFRFYYKITKNNEIYFISYMSAGREPEKIITQQEYYNVTETEQDLTEISGRVTAVGLLKRLYPGIE